MRFIPAPSDIVDPHALRSAANKRGLLVSSSQPISGSSANATDLNAAGAHVYMVGRMHYATGPGSKVISAAGGGKVFWRSRNITFANAGTVVRVGIQDVDAAGLPDGVFDTYAELVGGVDTIALINSHAIDNGTKTVAHGDLVAIGLLMVSRGGADNVGTSDYNHGLLDRLQFPYKVTAGAKNSTSIYPIAVVTDDGTLGWLEECYFEPANVGLIKTFAANSALDEYAAVFQLPYKTRMLAASWKMQDIAAADDFEAILYSDPWGTPAIVGSVVVDASYLAATGLGWIWMNLAGDMEANTNYGFAIRPTTNNTISIYYQDYTGIAEMKQANSFGTNIKLAARADQTGPFVETDSAHLPVVSFRLDFLG